MTNHSKAEWVEQQKQQLKSYRQKIRDIAANYTASPESVAELFSFAEKFYKYSPRNIMLIRSQNPAACFVGSFNFYKEKGYSVRKGEHGYKIFVPTTATYFRESPTENWVRLRDASPGQKAMIHAGIYETRQELHYKLGTVFEITQTTCPPEDYPKILSPGYDSEEHAVIYRGVERYCNSIGVTVNTEKFDTAAVRGCFLPQTRLIEINSFLNDTERLSTLNHELGHAIMHATGVRDLPVSQIELEADALAIMLDSHIGIALTDTRKNHLAQQIMALSCKDNYHFDMESTLKRVSECFSKMIEDFDNCLQQEIGVFHAQSMELTKTLEQKI